jgi:para-nitrobenzyl esterase
MNPRRTRASVSADESQCTLQRRAALRKTAALLGGLASAMLLPATAAEKTPHRTGAAGDTRRGSVIAADGAPIVDTGGGKVVGYLHNGIQTFKGIPYAESTEGANRFMPPVKVKAWSGVRSSRQYGNVAPQAPRQGWANDEEAFMFSWDDGVQGEDCLRINVWTPSVNGNKRPVMVWLHGGGFSAGSGQELKSYDGENLARRGNVVVVSLNHRLNVLGHLNLAQYGDRYASSANLGMLDIVAALEWVRDHIEGFGGDPSSVTVFGQSGGGGKVGALMGMPAASGLFHRAIVESGSVLRLGSEDKSRQLAELIVAELGLNRTTIHEIQTLPYEKLIQASTKILSEHPSTPKGALPDFRRIANSLGFAPIVDGSILPAHPFDPQASALSADIPMIIGSTLNEFITALNHPEVEKMTEAELEQRVRGVYGDRTPKVIEAFKQRSPQASPFDLWSHIGAAGIRRSAVAQATAKAALGRAPAYLYWFAWQTPVLSGRPRAFHCAEIPFVFDNTDRCENMTGGGPDARALAAIMSDAWIQFARTGNPNHPRMPRWDAFSPDRKQTMIFDNKSVQVDGPDAAEQDSVAEA